MGDEQREHVRFALAVAAELQIEGAGGVPLAASTQNLSAGGVSVLAPRILEEHQMLRVSLFLTQDGIEDADAEPFDAPARVRWVAPMDDGRSRAGLQFAALNVEQSKALEHFLKALGES